jgi:hypothetical protein
VDEAADEDEISLELEELEDNTDEASESSSFIAFNLASSSACIMMSFGAFFKYSLSPSVKGPRPILVKKLIAYLVFLGLSFGNNSLNHSAISGSSVSKRFTKVPIPIASAMSWTTIFKKIREELVVSSSFKWIAAIQDQESESVCKR